MLNVRAVYQADLAEEFYADRADREVKKNARYRELLSDYVPFALCG